MLTPAERFFFRAQFDRERLVGVFWFPLWLPLLPCLLTSIWIAGALADPSIRDTGLRILATFWAFAFGFTLILPKASVEFVRALPARPWRVFGLRIAAAFCQSLPCVLLFVPLWIHLEVLRSVVLIASAGLTLAALYAFACERRTDLPSLPLAVILLLWCSVALSRHDWGTVAFAAILGVGFLVECAPQVARRLGLRRCPSSVRRPGWTPLLAAPPGKHHSPLGHFLLVNLRADLRQLGALVGVASALGAGAAMLGSPDKSGFLSGGGLAGTVLVLLCAMPTCGVIANASLSGRLLGFAHGRDDDGCLSLTRTLPVPRVRALRASMFTGVVSAVILSLGCWLAYEIVAYRLPKAASAIPREALLGASLLAIVAAPTLLWLHRAWTDRAQRPGVVFLSLPLLGVYSILPTASYPFGLLAAAGVATAVASAMWRNLPSLDWDSDV